MKTKKQAFDIPFIGYDYGTDYGWDFDVLFGQYGNPIIGIKIKNIVEQYSADPDNYLHFHTVLNQVVSIIGEGRIIQKLDIFSKKRYTAEPSNQFLQQKYSEHFDGRLFKTIETVLFFTDIVDDKLKKKNKPYDFSEKNYKDLRDKCQKVLMLLKQSGCEPEFLFEKDFEFYISGVLSMQFTEIPVFDNIKSTNEYLQIGNRFVKNISYVDVTCPFVLKIHRIVEKESLAGNHIIIIGDKDHPEVQGICGWCQGPYTVIRNKEEADAFVPPKGKKISIVSQTTFNYNKFKDLVEILCKKRYDNNVLNILNILNTICNATEERQREAKNIAGEVDTMLVVGGRHSSNTQKLFEICKKECGNTYYIQTPVDLDSEMFQCSSYVGITAGASTPNKIIEEVQEHVRIKF